MARNLFSVYKCPLCPERQGAVSIDADAWLRCVANQPQNKASDQAITIDLTLPVAPASQVVVFNRGNGLQHPCPHMVDLYIEATVVDANGDPAADEMCIRWVHPSFKRWDKEKDIYRYMWQLEMGEEDVPDEYYDFKRVEHSWPVAGCKHELGIDGDIKVARNPLEFLRQLRKCEQRMQESAP